MERLQSNAASAKQRSQAHQIASFVAEFRASLKSAAIQCVIENDEPKIQLSKGVYKELNVQQRFLEKCRDWVAALAAAEDPRGGHIGALELRIQRLEGEVEDLRRCFLKGSPTSAQIEDTPSKR